MLQGRKKQLILIKYFLLVFFGFSGGLIIAAGIFSFIVLIGVINRLVSRTQTAKYLALYETIAIIGGTLGNLIIMFSLKVPVGVIGIIIFGVFSGIFVGCLCMALAEVAKVVPVFAKRIKLVKGMPYIVLGIAVGKLIGSLKQLL